jgi:hypothetical protein
MSRPSLTQTKLDLFERAGEALGVARSDFGSTTDYAQAVERALGKLKLDPNGRSIIQAIERELGLDKLGVSLDAVIDAMLDPEANEELNKALLEQAGESPSDVKTLLVRPDEIGMYGASAA